MTVLGPGASYPKVREHALVLSSMGVEHAVVPVAGGFGLVVRDRDYERGARAIDRYEEENRDWPPPRKAPRPRFPPTSVAAFACFALIAFALLTGPAAAGSLYFARGTSVSTEVLGLGEPTGPLRAVTALTLHADGGHVLGNAISGTIFGSAVMRRLGPGLGGLSIVVAGAIGNAANALHHHLEGDLHRSIGASTAVFAAIGVLAATQIWVDKKRPPAGGLAGMAFLRYLAPIAGGLALLGALGASPTSDLGAHGYGFAAGLLFGLGFAALSMRLDARAHRVVGAVAGLMAVAIIGGSWALLLA